MRRLNERAEFLNKNCMGYENWFHKEAITPSALLNEKLAGLRM